MMSTNFRKQQLEHAMTHDLRNQVMRGQTHPHAQAQFAKGGEEMAALRPAVDKKPRGMERVAFHEVYGVAAKAAPAARPAAGYGVGAKGGGFVVSFEEEFGGGARKEAGGCAGGCGCGGACGGATRAPTPSQPTRAAGQRVHHPSTALPLQHRSGHGHGRGGSAVGAATGLTTFDVARSPTFGGATLAPGQRVRQWQEALAFDAKVEGWVSHAAHGQGVMGVFKIAGKLLVFESCDDAIAFVLKSQSMAKWKTKSGGHPYKSCALVTCSASGATVTCQPCPSGWTYALAEVLPGVTIPMAPCVPTTSTAVAQAAAKQNAIAQARWLQSVHHGYVIIVEKKEAGPYSRSTFSYVTIDQDPTTPNGVTIDGEALQHCDDGQLATFVQLLDDGMPTGIYYQTCDMDEQSCVGADGLGCPAGTVCARCGGKAFPECTPLNGICGSLPLNEWVDAGNHPGYPAPDDAGYPAPSGTLEGFIFGTEADAQAFIDAFGNVGGGPYEVMATGDGFEVVKKEPVGSSPCSGITTTSYVANAKAKLSAMAACQQAVAGCNAKATNGLHYVCSCDPSNIGVPVKCHAKLG